MPSGRGPGGTGARPDGGRRAGLPKRLFERALWGSRLALLVAVVPGVMLASVTFYLASAETLRALWYLGRYVNLALVAEDREGVGADAVGAFVAAADWCLIAAVLTVFALGLYELFVGKLEAAPGPLRVRTLDRFVGRIVGLVLLMLVVEFFRQALRVRYDGGLHLLYFAIGVLLAGGALYVGARRLSGD